MKAQNILKHEESFFAEKKDSHGKTFIIENKSITSNDGSESMNYVSCKRDNGDDSFFYKEKIEKTQIVLHFTAGYLKGDIATLTTPSNHVSVPFVIGRNGKILSMWYSGYWSYHLGPGAIGGNSKGSKRTIAIEISNIGFLNKTDNGLVTAYGKDDFYCSLNETEFYQELDSDFRDHNYFASFTDDQYTSIISLLRFLTAQYNIPREFLAEEDRFKVGSTSSLPDFKGIVSHINYRDSGKWDIGPAFDWDRIIKGVKS